MRNRCVQSQEFITMTWIHRSSKFKTGNKWKLPSKWIPRELVKKNKCSAVAVVFQNDLDHSDMWILLKDFIPNHQRKYPLHYHVTTTGKTFMTLTLFLRVTLLWLLHWSKYLSAWIMDWQQWYLLLIWLFLWPAGIKEQVMMSQVKAGFEKPD